MLMAAPSTQAITNHIGDERRLAPKVLAEPAEVVCPLKTGSLPHPLIVYWVWSRVQVLKSPQTVNFFNFSQFTIINFINFINLFVFTGFALWFIK